MRYRLVQEEDLPACLDLLDSNGRQTVSLERRPSGITIENREQWLANEAKLARLVGGVR